MSIWSGGQKANGNGANGVAYGEMKASVDAINMYGQVCMCE